MPRGRKRKFHETDTDEQAKIPSLPSRKRRKVSHKQYKHKNQTNHIISKRTTNNFDDNQLNNKSQSLGLGNNTSQSRIYTTLNDSDDEFELRSSSESKDSSQPYLNHLNHRNHHQTKSQPSTPIKKIKNQTNSPHSQSAKRLKYIKKRRNFVHNLSPILNNNNNTFNTYNIQYNSPPKLSSNGTERKNTPDLFASQDSISPEPHSCAVIDYNPNKYSDFPSNNNTLQLQTTLIKKKTQPLLLLPPDTGPGLGLGLGCGPDPVPDSVLGTGCPDPDPMISIIDKEMDIDPDSDMTNAVIIYDDISQPKWNSNWYRYVEWIAGSDMIQLDNILFMLFGFIIGCFIVFASHFEHQSKLSSPVATVTHQCSCDAFSNSSSHQCNPCMKQYFELENECNDCYLLNNELSSKYEIKEKEINKYEIDNINLERKLNQISAKKEDNLLIKNTLNQCEQTRDKYLDRVNVLKKELKLNGINKCSKYKNDIKRLEHELGECNVEYGSCEMETRQKDKLDEIRIEEIAKQKRRFNLCNEQLKNFKSKKKQS